MAEGVRLSSVTPAEDYRTVLVNQVSWGAVLAGTAMALVVHLVLTMIGVGVGLISLDPAGEGGNADAGTFSIVAGIWWLASGVIAALIGGYTAGRLSGRPKESTTGWHGLASWAATTLVIFFLLTTAVASLVGGVFNAVGSFAETAADVAGPVIADADPLADIERRITLSLGAEDPAAVGPAIAAAIQVVASSDEDEAATAREEAAQALATARGIPIDEAREQVAELEARFEAAVEDAAATAEDAADAVGTASLFAALALLLGAAAGWFGGRWGKVQPTVTV